MKWGYTFDKQGKVYGDCANVRIIYGPFPANKQRRVPMLKIA